MNSRAELVLMITNTYAFYEKECSDFAINAWLEALRGAEIDQIKRAFSYHMTRSDNGQFMPKPADIVRILRGSTSDRASVAWGKVDRAVRSVGSYQSIVFDDYLIHLVIEDMGGWIHICGKTEEEWVFTENHFKTSYKGYASRADKPQPLKRLIGISEADCQRRGLPAPDPILIGDEKRALNLLQKGSDKPRLQFSPLTDVMERMQIEKKTAPIEQKRA